MKILSDEARQALKELRRAKSTTILDKPGCAEEVRAFMASIGAEEKSACEWITTEQQRLDIVQAATSGVYDDEAMLDQEGDGFSIHLPTPQAVAARMAKYLRVRFDSAVCEPSCGNGALVKALEEYTLNAPDRYVIRRTCAGHPDVLFDVRGDLARAEAQLQRRAAKENLVDPRYEIKPWVFKGTVRCNDLRLPDPPSFDTVLNASYSRYDWTSTELFGRTSFDRIIMNPPWWRMADCDHIALAWHRLADGGRIVAISSGAWTWSESDTAMAFRANVLQQCSHSQIEWLSRGTFRYGQRSYDACILTLDKGKQWTE